MQKISVKTIYLILVISIGLVGLGVGSTFAMFTASSKIDNPISFTAGIFGESDVIETVEVTVPAGETKATNLHVTNSTNSNLNYVMWYIDEGLDIELGSKRTDSGTYQTTIGAGEEHQYEVSIRNNSNSDVTVVIGVSSGTGSVTLSSDMKMVPQSELDDPNTSLSDFDYILGGGTYKNESDMSYSIPNGYIYLINYKGSSTDVTIPATYTVNGTKYNTVVLSADMDEASVGVFTDNKTITSVSINENVKLVNFSTGTATDYSADNLFSGCTNLTTISSLPNNISSVFNMFRNCTNLTGTIEIKAENISNVNDYTFRGTTKNIKISLPGTSTATYNAFTSYYNRPNNVTFTTSFVRNIYFSLFLPSGIDIKQQSVYSNTTWADFVNSSWNTYGLYISSDNTIKDGNNWEVSPDGIYAVRADDLIIDGKHYNFVE